MKKINLAYKRTKLEDLLKFFRPNSDYYSTLINEKQRILNEIAKGILTVDDAKKELDDIEKKLFQPYSSFSDKKNGNSFEFIRELGISFCPYCNINDVYAVINEKDEKICRPDIDHFLPKSDFPKLQLELENLVPSCLMCNQRLKGKTPFSNRKYLNPYREDFDSIMEIKLDLNGPNYLSEDNFKIIFVKRKGANPAKVKKAKNNIGVFKLDDRYQYYKNEIIPIMKNIAFYKHAKRQEIENLFNQNYCVPFRIILLPEENCEINKTRLGKLKRDVIKALLD